MNRAQLINATIHLRAYLNYLEIGVQDGGTFNSIECQNKTGVDPDADRLKNARGGTFHAMTSDEFFASTDEKFDIIFIDGLHQWEQVLKDAENALEHLSWGGTVIFHDCFPTTPDQAQREMHDREWCGDVWKAIVHMRAEWENVVIRVHPDDYGLGVMRRVVDGFPRVPLVLPNPVEELTYDDLQENKVMFLGLTVDEHQLL